MRRNQHADAGAAGVHLRALLAVRESGEHRA